MRLRIVGAGALGTVFAVRLAAAGHDVTVQLRDPGGATERSFAIEGTEPRRLTLPVVGPDGPRRDDDGTLVSTKSYDVAAAVAGLAGRSPGPLLLVQNGLGILEAASAGWREATPGTPFPDAARAVVVLPATWLAPGRVRQPGPGALTLPGEGPPATLRSVDRWADAFAPTGIDVQRSPTFEREVWRKLLANAAINPVTADHGVENGRLAEEPWRGQALALLHEARAVAAAEGFAFGEAEAERDLFAVVRATAGNRSSMLQDLDRRRRTEIEAISGALLERGARHGLELPATRRAAERIRQRSGAATQPL